MTNPNRTPNDYPSAQERGPLINDIVTRRTIIPFSNLSLGNRATDEPTQFDTFALYFPLQPRQYELLLTGGAENGQAPNVALIRDRLKAAELNDESLRLHQERLTPAIKQHPVLSDMGEGKVEVDAFGLPQLMIAFGHRVRDEEPVTLLFFPSHMMDPTPSLEEFSQLIEQVEDSERI
jgi:hypothetical protein